MKFTNKTWLGISGASWLMIGLMLLIKGLRFLVSSAAEDSEAPLLGQLVKLAGSRHQAALFLISVALFIGFIKGRTLLARTVKRIALRVQGLTGLLSITQVYDRKYYVILGVMVGIGLIFRWMPIPLDIRGTIDVAIGSALINGAMLYFRQALYPQPHHL